MEPIYLITMVDDFSLSLQNITPF